MFCGLLTANQNLIKRIKKDEIAVFDITEQDRDLLMTLLKARNQGCNRIIIDCEQLDMGDIGVWASILVSLKVESINEVTLVNFNEKAERKKQLYGECKVELFEKIRLSSLEELDEFFLSYESETIN